MEDWWYCQLGLIHSQQYERVIKNIYIGSKLTQNDIKLITFSRAQIM